MKLSIIIAAIILSTVSAFADTDMAMSARVFECWNMPTGMSRDDKAVINMTIDSSGEVIDITGTGEPTGMNRALIQTLSRAIQRCAPYSEFEPGVYEITADHKAKNGQSLDPFKDF